MQDPPGNDSGAPVQTAECDVCREKVDLRSTGRLALHSRTLIRRDDDRTTTLIGGCPGSGRPPMDHEGAAGLNPTNVESMWPRRAR